MRHSLKNACVYVALSMTDALTANPAPCCPALPSSSSALQEKRRYPATVNLILPSRRVFLQADTVTAGHFALFQNHLCTTNPVPSREERCTYVVDRQSELPPRCLALAPLQRHASLIILCPSPSNLESLIFNAIVFLTVQNLCVFIYPSTCLAIWSRGEGAAALACADYHLQFRISWHLLRAPTPPCFISVGLFPSTVTRSWVELFSHRIELRAQHCRLSIRDCVGCITTELVLRLP